MTDACIPNPSLHTLFSLWSASGAVLFLTKLIIHEFMCPTVLTQSLSVVINYCLVDIIIIITIGLYTSYAQQLDMNVSRSK